MRQILLICIAVCLVAIPFPAKACTSFVVQGDKGTLFGMNWDYFLTPARLTITQMDEYYRVFAITFETKYGYGTNGSMNERGFFAAVQDLYPAEPPTAALDDGTVEDMHDLAHWTPYVDSRVAYVESLLRDRHVANKYYRMHTLFADHHNKAAILEEIDGENILTPIEDGYLIMTNFPRVWADTKDREALYAAEADAAPGNIGVARYYTAQEMIKASMDTFDVESAFAVLEATSQGGAMPTRYSAVYDPEAAVVYVALNREYGRIWKVSIRDATISTYQGFETEATFVFDELGISFDTLMAQR